MTISSSLTSKTKLSSSTGFDDIDILAIHYYQVPTTTTTICALVLTGGRTVVGTSSCVHNSQFSEELGRTYALEDAKYKAGELIGFHHKSILAETDEEIKYSLEWVNPNHTTPSNNDVVVVIDVHDEYTDEQGVQINLTQQTKDLLDGSEGDRAKIILSEDILIAFDVYFGQETGYTYNRWSLDLSGYATISVGFERSDINTLKDFEERLKKVGDLITLALIELPKAIQISGSLADLEAALDTRDDYVFEEAEFDGLMDEQPNKAELVALSKYGDQYCQYIETDNFDDGEMVFDFAELDPGTAGGYLKLSFDRDSIGEAVDFDQIDEDLFKAFMDRFVEITLDLMASDDPRFKTIPAESMWAIDAHHEMLEEGWVASILLVSDKMTQDEISDALSERISHGAEMYIDALSELIECKQNH